MASVTAGVQMVGLVGYVAILIAVAGIWRRWEDARALIIVPGIWAMYGAIYYVLVLAGRFTNEALLLWGALHRMMAMMMVLGGLIVLWLILSAPPPEYDDDWGGDGRE